MRKPNTEIVYLYSDASNHKYRGLFLVSGELTMDELEPYFFDNEFFVATEVGLRHLLTDSWSEDDHVLHSFAGFEPTDGTEVICSAEELITRFKNAATKGWFYSYV